MQLVINDLIVVKRLVLVFGIVPKDVRYKDLGGLDDVLKEIKELIEFPLKHPEVYDWLGVQPPRGVLLHGPPGCGKTALANAIANECNVPFFRVSAPEIVSGMSGMPIGFVCCNQKLLVYNAAESDK